MQTDTTENNQPMWAILELMGHVKTGALLSKDTQLGTAMLRADVPQADGTNVTQLVNPSSIYRITFCSEEIARACAAQCSAKPMESWELKHLMPPPAPKSPANYIVGVDPAEDDDDHEQEDEDNVERQY